VPRARAISPQANTTAPHHTMSWRELIADLYATRGLPSGVAARPEFYPAASSASIARAEALLNATWPNSLRSLLKETNGVMEMLALDGGDWFESMWLLWNVDEIVRENRRGRGKRAPAELSRLVFFATAGADGVQFAFPVEDGTCASRIMVWHPLGAELDEFAPSLDGFLRGWLDGTLVIRGADQAVD
jgi:hypothetical protein